MGKTRRATACSRGMAGLGSGDSMNTLQGGQAGGGGRCSGARGQSRREVAIQVASWDGKTGRQAGKCDCTPLLGAVPAQLPTPAGAHPCSTMWSKRSGSKGSPTFSAGGGKGEGTCVFERMVGMAVLCCTVQQHQQQQRLGWGWAGLACADAAGGCGLGGDVHAAAVVGVPHLRRYSQRCGGEHSSAPAEQSAAWGAGAAKDSKANRTIATPTHRPMALPFHPQPVHTDSLLPHPPPAPPPTVLPPSSCPHALPTCLVHLALPHQLPELGVGHVAQLVGAPAGAGKGRQGQAGPGQAGIV
jgi:hypothetical protein